MQNNTAQPNPFQTVVPSQDITTPPPATNTPNVVTAGDGTPPPSAPSPVNSNDGKPKRKISGRVIATVFGLLLVAGGIVAGLALVSKPQNLGEHAAGCTVTQTGGLTGTIHVTGCTTDTVTKHTCTGAAPAGTTTSDGCIGYSQGCVDTQVGNGDYSAHAPSCGQCQQIDINSGGQPFGVANFGGQCTKKTCGQTCSTDSDCISTGGSGGQVGCRNGTCQNLNCIGKTVPGANCDCSTLNACGQPCSAASGLCQTGSSCRYIVGPNCTNNPNPSRPTNTYCVPPDNLAATHTWSLARCVARDTGNSYSLFNGQNPTVAQIQQACQGRPSYTCQSNPFTDTFDGSTLDARYYIPTVTPPTVSGGQLVSTIVNPDLSRPATAARAIETNGGYSGDFQIDADAVSIDSGNKDSGAIRLILLKPGAGAGSVTVSITLERGVTKNRIYSQQNPIGSTTLTGYVENTSIPKTGLIKLRLVRTNGTVVAYFDAGSGYTQLGTYTGFTDTVAVRLTGASQVTSNPSSVTTVADNFSLTCPGTTPTATPTATPTTPPGAPQCTGIKIYDANFNLIDPANYSKLTPGTSIKIAVTGTTPSGNFDKARFFVNDTTTPIGESSNTVPSNSAEYYIDYTIPSGATSFTISAELHQVQLDQWI